MDRPLLGRYALDAALVDGRPVTAHDEVLSRPVDVVRLPVGDGTPAAALRRVRNAVSQTQRGLPIVLDLAVVAGHPVAVLMAGAGSDQLRTLAARAAGGPTARPAPSPSVADVPIVRSGRRGAAPSLAWATGGAALVLAVVALLPGGSTGGPVSPAAQATSLAPGATPSTTPVPSGPPSPPSPSPDEGVVLLLAAVRDDPGAGVAGPRLLDLLRGLDASTGEQRLVLARRTAGFAEQEAAAGRLDAAHADRARTVMAAVVASG